MNNQPQITLLTPSELFLVSILVTTLVINTYENTSAGNNPWQLDTQFSALEHAEKQLDFLYVFMVYNSISAL